MSASAPKSEYVEMLERTGARSRKEIPEPVLKALNIGAIPTVNLVETLAIDQGALFQSVSNAIGFTEICGEKAINEAVAGIAELTFTRRISRTAEFIHSVLKDHSEREDWLQRFGSHTSDMARSWVPFVDACDGSLTLENRFDRLRLCAADEHFGVREWAWMAVRPILVESLDQGLTILDDWVIDANENIRRFATELTRPRGVWCKYIRAFINDPKPGLRLLEPVRSDDSKYVRDSVGNWLNDAGKTHPNWVREVCDRWQAESPTKETAYAVRRALRNL